MEFFQIHNWEKFQHYSKRNPPWIRLYQTLLRDIRYQRLTDTQRSHLIGLFLLAVFVIFILNAVGVFDFGTIFGP